MANSYKSLKEDFVSNLTGGELWEINYVTAVAPAAAFLWSALQRRLSFFSPYEPAAGITDFLLNVVSILLVTTVYASAPGTLSALLFGSGIALHASRAVFSAPSRRSRRVAKPPVRDRDSNEPDDSNTASESDSEEDDVGIREKEGAVVGKEAFVTTYRGSMMVITCIAILAVDFRIFPRRFAKVETWGTSLMDLGVGSFVYSAGLVAARSVLKDRQPDSRVSVFDRFWTSILHSSPLFILGAVRLYTVKNLDYAEHVSEYGVHWNFFFTLAFLPPFVALFHYVSFLIPSYAALSVIVALAYQALLSFHPMLQAYILLAPRDTGPLSQNREGVFSFWGYLAIFLAGQGTGIYTLAPATNNGISTSLQRQYPALFTGRLVKLYKLIGWSVLWIGLHHLATNPRHGLSLTTSRRLANLPYVLWVTAFNTAQLAAFYLIELVSFPSPSSSEEEVRCSPILESFNRNGLRVFLAANLLTGLINLTLPTLEMGNTKALAVLIGYAAVLVGVSYGADYIRGKRGSKKQEKPKRYTHKPDFASETMSEDERRERRYRRERRERRERRQRRAYPDWERVHVRERRERY